MSMTMYSAAFHWLASYHALLRWAGVQCTMHMDCYLCLMVSLCLGLDHTNVLILLWRITARTIQRPVN